MANYLLNSPLEQFETSSFSFYHSLQTSVNDLKGYSELLYFSSENYNTFFNISMFNLNFFFILILLRAISFYAKDYSFFWLSLLIFFVFIDFLPFQFTESFHYNVNVSNSNDISQSFMSGFYSIETSSIFDLICPGTILSFTVIYLFSESDEDSETIIPSLSEVIYIPISKMLNSLLNSSVGKNLKDEDDLYSIIAGIFGAVLLFNIQGMIPYTHTITSSLANTLFISLGIFIFILANMIHQQGINHLLNLFMPQGCPIALVPLLIPIELISYCFRVVSLSVRLFANMMAGHTLLKVIVGFSWAMIQAGTLVMFLANLIPTAALFVLVVLEFAVALIQAYIFVTLTCIYLKDIYHGH